MRIRTVSALIAVFCISSVASCASRTKYERKVLRVIADAKANTPDFAEHFDQDVSKEIVADYREILADDIEPKFEFSDGPKCVRAYWGNYAIDHSYYFFFEVQDGRTVISGIESSAGFGESLGHLFLMEHGNQRESVHETCETKNGDANGAG